MIDLVSLMPEAVFPMPGYGAFVRTADRTGGANYPFTIVLFEVEFLAFCSSYSGTNQSLIRVRYRKKACIERPMVPLAERECIANVVRAFLQDRNNVGRLCFAKRGVLLSENKH